MLSPVGIACALAGSSARLLDGQAGASFGRAAASVQSESPAAETGRAFWNLWRKGSRGPVRLRFLLVGLTLRVSEIRRLKIHRSFIRHSAPLHAAAPGSRQQLEVQTFPFGWQGRESP